MINNFITILLSILFLFTSSIISQNKKNHKRREPINTQKLIRQNKADAKHKLSAFKKEVSKGNPRKESRKNFNKRINNGSTKNKRKEKKYSERPRKLVQKHYPKRKKKKEIIYVEDETILEKEIVYIEKPAPSKGYCRLVKIKEADYYVSDEIYPDFSIKFINGNINYNYTSDDKHYYEIQIRVRTVNEIYFEKFGILIKYFNHQNDLLIFNEQEEMLFSEEQYEYSKVINLKHSGYVKLRIGFYNSFDKTFYPARYLGNKTELSIYVKEGENNTIDITTMKNEIR